jgi:hypothetical protein
MSILEGPRTFPVASGAGSKRRNLETENTRTSKHSNRNFGFGHLVHTTYAPSVLDARNLLGQQALLISGDSDRDSPLSR